MSTTLNCSAVVDETPKTPLFPTVEGKDRLKQEGTIFSLDMNRFVEELVRGRYRGEEVDDPASRVELLRLFSEGD